MEKTNLLHCLLLSGNYHIIVEKIVSYLDLTSLQNLSQVDKTCHSYLKPLVNKLTTSLRRSWLSSGIAGLNVITEIRDDCINYPIVVCDDSEIILFAFDPNIGWSAHVYSSNTLGKRFAQCLYNVHNVDKASLDFPWTQFVGNVCLSSKYLLITPTTPEHQIHFWMRLENKFPSSPLTIKHQMADRYANLMYDSFFLVYRTNLFSLYKIQDGANVMRCWSYRPNIASKGRAKFLKPF